MIYAALLAKLISNRYFTNLSRASCWPLNASTCSRIKRNMYIGSHLETYWIQTWNLEYFGRALAQLCFLRLHWRFLSSQRSSFFSKLLSPRNAADFPLSFSSVTSCYFKWQGLKITVIIRLLAFGNAGILNVKDSQRIV